MQWYAKNEGVYFSGLISIFKVFDNFSKTGRVHCLVVFGGVLVLAATSMVNVTPVYPFAFECHKSVWSKST